MHEKNATNNVTNNRLYCLASCR